MKDELEGIGRGICDFTAICAISDLRFSAGDGPRKGDYDFRNVFIWLTLVCG